MSRIRQIKPAFFKHAELYDAEVSSGLPLRIAFAGLWTAADRRGVFTWSRNLKPDVLPYDPCDMLAVLDALAAGGFVVRYEVGGKPYGVIPSFAEHQHFHKDEKASALPAPGEHQGNTVPAPYEPGSNTEVNGQVSGIRYRVSGNGKKRLVPPRVARPSEDERFAALWAAYPRRAGGNSRADAYKAWRARVTSGIDPADLLAGVERYAAYVRSRGMEGTEFVKLAKTFLGPAEHWTEEFAIPPSAQSATGDNPFLTPEMRQWAEAQDAREAAHA